MYVMCVLTYHTVIRTLCKQLDIVEFQSAFQTGASHLLTSWCEPQTGEPIRHRGEHTRSPTVNVLGK